MQALGSSEDELAVLQVFEEFDPDGRGKISLEWLENALLHLNSRLSFEDGSAAKTVLCSQADQDNFVDYRRLVKVLFDEAHARDVLSSLASDGQPMESRGINDANAELTSHPAQEDTSGVETEDIPPGEQHEQPPTAELEVNGQDHIQEVALQALGRSRPTDEQLSGALIRPSDQQLSGGREQLELEERHSREIEIVAPLVPPAESLPPLPKTPEERSEPNEAAQMDVEAAQQSEGALQEQINGGGMVNEQEVKQEDEEKGDVEVKQEDHMAKCEDEPSADEMTVLEKEQGLEAPQEVEERREDAAKQDNDAVVEAKQSNEEKGEEPHLCDEEKREGGTKYEDDIKAEGQAKQEKEAQPEEEVKEEEHAHQENGAIVEDETMQGDKAKQDPETADANEHHETTDKDEVKREDGEKREDDVKPVDDVKGGDESNRKEVKPQDAMTKEEDDIKHEAASKDKDELKPQEDEADVEAGKLAQQPMPVAPLEEIDMKASVDETQCLEAVAAEDDAGAVAPAEPVLAETEALTVQVTSEEKTSPEADPEIGAVGAAVPQEPEKETTVTQEPEKETTVTQEPEKETTVTQEPEKETTATQEPEKETTVTQEPEKENTAEAEVSEPFASELAVLRPSRGAPEGTWLTCGAKHLMRSSGKFYHEVLFICQDPAQVGWLTEHFGEGPRDHGVGDDANGWAVDGLRHMKYNAGKELHCEWPRMWRKGDIIGFAINFEAGTMNFSLNGEWVPQMAMSFEANGRQVFPAISSCNDFCFNLPEQSWTHRPPSAEYKAWAGTGQFRRPIFTEPAEEVAPAAAAVHAASSPDSAAGGQPTAPPPAPLPTEVLEPEADPSSSPMSDAAGVGTVTNLTLLRPMEVPATDIWLTAGLKDYMRNSGKFYHEVVIHEVSDPQLGWVTEAFKEGPLDDHGVGDDEHSWAVDGARHSHWHRGQPVKCEWPRSWQPNDVIGFALNIDKGHMLFSYNGEWFKPAYRTVKLPPGVRLYPAVSTRGGFHLNVAPSTWVHRPPDQNYLAWAASGDFRRPKRQASKGVQKVRETMLRMLRPQEVPADDSMWITLGAADVMQRTGKYYHEVVVGSTGDPQVGWATENFREGPFNENGIGDDDQSWAADGLRHCKWHAGQQVPCRWPRAWHAGDVIGFAVDIDAGMMKFSLNGQWVPQAQMRFQAHGFRMYPALSMRGDFLMNIAPATWEHSPPSEGFKPWATSGNFRRPRAPNKSNHR